MSTTDILGREAADLQSTSDRARAAVKVFHRMQPSLTAYARALTGRPDVRVVMSADSNGHTDGKKIFYRPPLALGDNTPHERRLCDRRDSETLRQMCPACDVREQVLIVIYHEIGHIAHGSFEVMEENDRAEALKYGLSLVDRKYADAVKVKVDKAPLARKSTYIGMAGLVSPYLPGIVNALEDARVNRDTSIARKGTKIMFQVDTMRVLSEGFENKMPDGSVERVFWRDRPLNAQMICALYARSAGYKMEDYFVPEVIAALDDFKIKELLRDFGSIRNAKGVYSLAIALLMRFRELGFYKHPTDPQVEEDEPEQEPEEEQQDDTSSEDDSKEEHQDGDGTEEDSGDPDESGDESGDAGDGGTMGEPSDSESSSEQGAEGGDDSGDPVGDPQEPEGGGTAPGEDGTETGDASEEGADSGGSDSGSEGDPSTEDDGQGDDTDSSVDDLAGDADASDPSDGAGGEDLEATERDGEGGSEGEDDEADASSPSTAGSQGGEVDEVDDGEGDDPSETSSSGSHTGEGTGESGPDEGGEHDDVEAGSEDASGAGSDHDSSEAGSEVQGLGDEEGVGDEPSTASEADESSDDLLGDTDNGDHSDDLGSEEADDVRGDDAVSEGTGDNEPGGEPEDDMAIDSGADEGLGGVEVIEDSAFDRLPMGSPDEVNEVIHEIAHPEDRPDYIKEEAEADDEMERAVVQGLYFETPSRNIFGVREHYYGNPVMIDGYNMSQGWDQTGYRIWGYSRKQMGVEGDFDCSEAILGSALLRMRVAFADNQRSIDLRHKKSGKVDARVLGRRVHFDDDRLFKRRVIPGKKDYFVLIGIDISGSTIGENIVLAKRAAMAQAELCHRLGIKFAVFAHSGNYHAPDGGRADGMDVDIYHVKDPDESWTDNVKKRLTELGPDSVNIDGHTFEYYRKVLDQRNETHRVIMYYTDGKMPAENHDEELMILQREIKICKQRKYVLMGVGIRTDSPVRHGLDTVRVDTDEDLIKVVQHLEKRLLKIQ